MEKLKENVSLQTTNVSLDESSPELQKESLLKNDSAAIPLASMVKTPCQHHFHESCLRNWLEQKYECPYCRAGLPAMPGGED